MITLLATLALAGPPGEAENLTEDEGLVRFTLASDAGWRVWMAELAAAGWKKTDGDGQIAELVRGDRRAVAMLVGPAAEGSPWRGTWAEAPLVAPAELDGDCVRIPEVRIDLTLHLVADLRPDREDVEARRRLVTQRAVDVDGDGHLDALVPSLDDDQCPHETRWTVYLTRGKCGVPTGEVRGYWLRSPSWTGANRLVMGASHVTPKHVPGPGMEQRGDRSEWTWTHRFDGRRWITETEMHEGECVHCSVTTRCTIDARALDGPAKEAR